MTVRTPPAPAGPRSRRPAAAQAGRSPGARAAAAPLGPRPRGRPARRREPVRGRLASIDAGGGRRRRRPGGGRPTSIGPGELVKLARPGGPPGPTNAVAGMLVFPDGDRLVAAIDEADERAVVARSPAPRPASRSRSRPCSASSSLPARRRGRARRPARPDPPRAAIGRPARLPQRRPDRRRLPVGVARARSRCLIDDREQQVDRSAVAGRRRSTRPWPTTPSRRPSPSTSILTDGSRLRLADPGLRDGLLVGTTRFGAEVELDPAALLDCYVVGGPARYLSRPGAGRRGLGALRRPVAGRRGGTRRSSSGP